MEPRTDLWLAPSGEPFDDPVDGGVRQRRLRLAVALVTFAVIGIGLLGLVANTVLRSGPSEFDQRRERAEALNVEAASIEISHAGASTAGWAREEIRADRASGRLAIDRWQGDVGQDEAGPPIFAFIYDDQSAHIQSHRFDDPAESGPTWYLMEDNDGIDRAGVEQHFEIMWAALDDFTGASPRFAGTDLLRGEELERFDLFVPGSAYTEGQNVTIGGVGMIDPQNGVDYSFWFTSDGELRSMLIAAEVDGAPSTFESWSYLSDDPAAIDMPAAAKSWNEYESTSRD